MAIIYISHRMAEVYELSDRVSVLRDGQYVGSLVRDKLNAPELVRMMVGRPLSDLFNKERDIPRGQPRLRVEDLTDGGKIKPSSLVVHAGEIVGLAGLVGAGRSELAQLIFGVRKATAGVIEIDGEPVVIHSPRAAIENGIGFLTENRKEQGLFLELAAQGRGVLVFSTEFPEIYQIADRCIVMYKGKINGSLEREELNEAGVMALSTGTKTEVQV